VLCWGEGRRGSWCLTLHATRVATWPRYSRNMGRREERLLMLDVASNRVRNIFHNTFATHSQYLPGSI
jgi:hypothetical protein